MGILHEDISFFEKQAENIDHTFKLLQLLMCLNILLHNQPTMNQTIASPKPFYTHAWLYFLLAMAVIIAGFFPSFFNNLKQTDLLHHVHGMSATAWLLLLVVQPLLYSRGQISLHRKLGKVSFVLVPLLLFGGVKMVQLMIRRQAEYPPMEAFRLSFIDVVSMIAFVGFYGMAIYHRSTTGLHARYMAATVILLIPPGLTRLLLRFPGVDSFTKGLNINFILIEIALLLLLLDDKKRDGSFSRPYLILTAIIVFLHATLPFARHWQWWQNFMNGIV